MSYANLGDRMKRYEHTTRHTLTPRTYTILRVDGRAFHTFLRHADKPFDPAVMASMDSAAAALCKDISGAVFAFTQSDEISVLITDFKATDTQPWFGGVVQKIVSVAASVATVAFNAEYSKNYDGATATFDARAFTIPDPVEVANYFVWRQRDGFRNAVAMSAQSEFSHAELQGVNTDQAQELLWAQRCINFNNYPDGAKRGRVCQRTTREEDVTFTDRRAGTERTTGAVRSHWETAAAPHFTADPAGWLLQSVPLVGHPATP